jgi:hypothetical protein
MRRLHAGCPRWWCRMNSVLVYCEGAAEHPHARSKIVTFQDGPVGWTVALSDRQLLGRGVPTAVTYEVVPGEYGEYRALPLIGSDLEGLPPRTDGLTEAIDEDKRVRMECPLCRLNETRRGGEKLISRLDRLVEIDISEISLAAIGAALAYPGGFSR